MSYDLRAIILFCTLQLTVTERVCVIASSGCYSHDLTLKELALNLDSDITWVQIKIFKFSKTVNLPKNWKKFYYDSNVHDGKTLLYSITVFLQITTTYTLLEVLYSGKGIFPSNQEIYIILED